jgi:hypothetical protein
VTLYSNSEYVGRYVIYTESQECIQKIEVLHLVNSFSGKRCQLMVAPLLMALLHQRLPLPPLLAEPVMPVPSTWMDYPLRNPDHQDPPATEASSSS